MSKRKTHEEYVAELAVKNPNIEVVGTYVDAKTKIKHKCKIDGYVWEALPSNILKGSGCRMCSSKRSHLPFIKTQEQYVLELNDINPNIEVLEKYVDARTSILHRCLIHNIEWKGIPSNILNGSGCSECKKEKYRNSRRKTHEEYLKEVSQSHPNIEVVDNYIDSHTKILHFCKIHNFYWEAKPNNILNGCGCPICGGTKKKTPDEYRREVLLLHPDIEVLDDYINATTPIKHKCLIDNYEWHTTPTGILSGNGCPKCGGTMKKSHDDYVHELSVKNPNIEVLGEYVTSKTSILHRCKIDGYEWYALPSNILKGRSCPKCSESNGETHVGLWLNMHNFEYIKQKTFDDCRDKKPLPFDFYLPTRNVAIEYQGRQHYEPVEIFGGIDSFLKQQKHDEIKRIFCKNNGIKLLEIPYYSNIHEELNNFLFI